jgi:hypothetical protein
MPPPFGWSVATGMSPIQIVSSMSAPVLVYSPS